VISLKAGLAGYIVPSKLYGILAAGRPYVAAVDAESEVASITEKYECGLLAEPSKPADVAERILELYRDRAFAAQLGRNARRAARDFDRRRQVRAYHDVFVDVVTRNGRPPSLSKRVFDVVLSAAGLLAAAPLFAVIAVAVKVADGGPVFYGQARVGRGGRLFQSWKFRSMVPHADLAGPRQARDADTRITAVGRLLRATAMDELPQLWNILRGDMSFVGPRALMPREIEVRSAAGIVPIDSVPGAEERHRVVPGLTGLAQIYADRDIPRRQKFRYDLLYARTQSFWLDLRLIGLSLWITARGRWERRGKKF
jgi:lipopolysaccharide/colanic/teichoic acid biosynthesis glycosyltransferase